MPWRVPSASPCPVSSREQSASGSAPAGRSTKAASGAPPDSVGAPLVGGSVGSSRALMRTTVPAEVTRPTEPRAVVRTAETMTSCLRREPPVPSGSSVEVRASNPVELSSTQQGSSATSSGMVAAAGADPPSDSSRTVRRGVPCSLATAASSSETRLSSSWWSSSRARSASMSRSSSSRSVSSSMRENDAICRAHPVERFLRRHLSNVMSLPDAVRPAMAPHPRRGCSHDCCAHGAGAPPGPRHRPVA